MRVRTISKRPVAIDLFSGAGGMSVGVEGAGFDVLAAVEYDPIHAAVYQFNFPETAMICADASRLTSEEILSRCAQQRRSA